MFLSVDLGAPSDFFEDLKNQGDDFMNKISGLGAEVGKAGEKFVENLSDNRIRDLDRSRGQRAERDRSVSTNQSALLPRLTNEKRAFLQVLGRSVCAERSVLLPHPGQHQPPGLLLRQLLHPR